MGRRHWGFFWRQVVLHTSNMDWKLRESSENKDGESIELLTGGFNSEGSTFSWYLGKSSEKLGLGSIELHTGGCSSVDSTIWEFSGIILIFSGWFWLTGWTGLAPKYHQNSELSSSEGIGRFLGATTDIYLDMVLIEWEPYLWTTSMGFAFLKQSCNFLLSWF